MRYRFTTSLQTRLMVVSISTAILALASAGGLATWRLYNDLFVRTKEDHYLAVLRFHEDVNRLQASLPPRVALEQAVEKYTAGQRWIRITSDDGQVLLSSGALGHPTLPPFPPTVEPKLVYHEAAAFIRCGQPINLTDDSVVYLETLTNVSHYSESYYAFLKVLALSSSTMIVGVLVGGMWLVRRSLQPLHNMNSLSNHVSPDNLADVRLMLEDPPTEVEQLAEAFNGMLNRLSQAWGAERQLLDTISHELRTPMAIIQGYVEGILRRGQNLNDNQRDNLNTALEEVQRVERLLSGLLDLVRAESATHALKLETIQLNDLIKEMQSSAQYLGQQSILADVPQDPVIAKADRDRLKQVLLNLLTNAIRYSDPENSITVRLQVSGSTALLQVQDQGIGISEEQQARIFERFYRVSEARYRSQGGLGLGLAITKALVENMRGELTVESTLGVGSVFTIHLPLIH